MRESKAGMDRGISGWLCGLSCLTLLLLGPALLGQGLFVPSNISPPPVAREMRGVWVATVGNIDWPSTNGLTTAQQKAELVALLDRAAGLKLNTVILQVRPGCDAIYPSRIEPWSEYLTGIMGKPPEPYYDPLAFAIEEAHKRGLELHAWFNPYRARHLQAKSPVAPNHISRTHPEWVRHYGSDLWLDPGEKGVPQYSLRVVMDVVNRYDIDGVHFDDYFYPYAEHTASGKDVEFPDEPSWRRFGARSRLSRDDWRRENVNVFVHDVYRAIKAAKPWVKFGISPFGIWRPGNPAQINGLDAFTELHADSRKWLVNGWVDYLAPQLYWGINPPVTSFPALLHWWVDQNARERLICPGLCSNNVGGKWRPEEIISQIEVTRHQPGASGHVHWGMKTLMRNGPLDEALQRIAYTSLALPPEMPWLSHSRPPKPALRCEPRGSNVEVNWSASAAQAIRWTLIQTQINGSWTSRIVPVSNGMVLFPAAGLEVIAASCIDRFGNSSPPAVLQRKP